MGSAMNKPDWFAAYPLRRLKPVDGMAVTAEVWDEAHEYHRQRQRYFALHGHGAGILAGLDVIASEPADSTVYLQPGLAIDAAGQTLIVPQPITYNLGRTASGLFYLVLTYGESAPRPPSGRPPDGAPLYVTSEYTLEALPALPDTPHVELARLRWQGRNAPIRNAKDPAHPGLNEIDLRYRRPVGAVPPPTRSLAVVYLGGSTGPWHGRGADGLARFVNQAGGQRLAVDEAVALTPGLEAYSLVCLVGHGPFRLSADELKVLYTYWQEGGTLFFEACRREAGAGAAEAAFLDVLTSLGVKLTPVTPDQRLMHTPHLFAALPAGYDGAPSVQIADGVVFSSADFGCVWQGEQRAGATPREAIRSALEWGANLLDLAVARRAEFRARPRP